jgi:hypothetical protein
MSTAAEFLITKEYRRFEEFCHACHRDRYIGLCYGPPGVGKTLSARQYARWDVIEPYLDAWSNAERVRQGPYGQLAACHTVLYTPTVTTTARSLEREVAGLVMQMNCVVDHARAAQATPDSAGAQEPCTLLIVDEADRLKMQGLEQLRDFYDRGAVGLVLIGMPGLEKRLGAVSATLFPRRVCPCLSAAERGGNGLHSPSPLGGARSPVGPDPVHGSGSYRRHHADHGGQLSSAQPSRRADQAYHRPQLFADHYP